MPLIDILTLVAFGAIATDLALQILRILRQKHSVDISLPGEFIRLGALVIMQVKFRMIGDPILIFGQLCTLTLLVIYIGVVIRYRTKA